MITQQEIKLMMENYIGIHNLFEDDKPLDVNNHTIGDVYKKMLQGSGLSKTELNKRFENGIDYRTEKAWIGTTKEVNK